MRRIVFSGEDAHNADDDDDADAVKMRRIVLTSLVEMMIIVMR